VGEYDDLLEEARSKAAAYMSTAKIYIPKMYTALINESKNVSPEDARDRIEKDCIGIWSKRTILDALPDEAKNPERQKSGRLGQKKRKFAAEIAAKSSAPESPAAEIRLDTHGSSTDRESTIDESSKHRSKEQLKTKEPATEQDQARSATERELLKQEVLVDRSGQGMIKPTRSKIGTQNVSNHILDDISSDRTNNLSTVYTPPTAANKPNKANLKTNVLNQEIALPCRQSRRYISSELNNGKNEFYISIEVNLDTGKIISARLGRNSERETNSFRNIY